MGISNSSNFIILSIFFLSLYTFYFSITQLSSSIYKSTQLRKTAEKFQTIEIQEDENIIANIYYNSKYDNYSIIQSNSPDKEAIAYAVYNKSYQRTGWDYLAISSYEKNNSKYSDSNKAYAMGYIEGYLTHKSISQNFFNMIRNHTTDYIMPDNLRDFISKNIEYMTEKAEKNMDHDKYWEHVYYIYKQILGLYDGYIAAVGYDVTGFYEIFLLNSLTDLDDVSSYYSVNNTYDFEKMDIEEIREYTMSKSHCSALIKLAEDFSDIWFGHNTWYRYASMLRIFKEYHFVTKNGYEKSKTTAFPSYPGLLFSSDDFYVLDSNLLVMETTNTIYNDSLYDVLKPECVLTWLRQVLANRLASSSEDWPEIFKLENSGTYNNQFMILDLNKINLKKKEIPDKSLIILEQLPGYTDTTDVTEYLKNGYWPSYNAAFSEFLYNMTGVNEQIEQKPELVHDIDYNLCSRAQIFKREQKNIKSNKDFERMLRYNDFRNDNLSYNKAYLTIAARYDIGDTKHYCHGATDVKYVSIKELLEGKSLIHIIAGPSNDQQPTFSWSNTTCKPYDGGERNYEGMIDVWNKDWVEYKTQLFKIQKRDDESSDDDNTDGPEKQTDNNQTVIISLGVSCGVLFILLVVFIILYVKAKRNNGDISIPSKQLELIDK